MPKSPAAPLNAQVQVSRRTAIAAVAVGGAEILRAQGPGSAAIGAAEAAMLARLQRGETAIITPKDLGASSDRDSSDALRTAMRLAARTGRPIELNDVIRADQPIAVPGGFSMRGPGMIDLSRGGSISIGAGVAALPNLAADIDRFETVLSFRAPHALSAGDVVVAWHPADFSFAPYRRHYRDGDMFRVAEVIEATRVRIFGIAQDAHAADQVKMFKLKGGQLRLQGLALMPPQDGVSLFLDGLVDVLLHGLKISSGRAQTGIEVHRCFNVGISDPDITVLAGDAYPIIISNSQKVTVQAARGLHSTRHCIALGGRDGEACVPTADVIVSGMIGENVAEQGVGAADIHGICKRVTYANCHLSMATIGGRDVTFNNCRITGRPAGAKTSGYAIAGSEVGGGTYTITNCHLVSDGDGITEACFLDLTVSGRSRDLRLVMRGNTFEHVGIPPTSGYLIKLFVGEEGEAPAKRLDIDIDGLNYVGVGPAQAIVMLAGRADISARTSLQLTGFVGAYLTILGCTQKANYNVAFAGMHDELTGLAQIGDASVTLSADRISPARPPSRRIALWAAPVTANRKATFDLTRARAGDTFRLVRAASAAGAALSVACVPPRTLAAGQWCDVTFDGDGWTVSGAGQL